MTLRPFDRLRTGSSGQADDLRGGATAARQAHNLEAAGSIPAPATMHVLSPDERAVLAVLRRHRGRAQAIGLEVVAGISGVSERTVQDIVAHLIERHQIPIGSAVKHPMGYFLIENENELAESLSQLVHRITALARRIAALKQSTTPIVLQQLALEIEEVA